MLQEEWIIITECKGRLETYPDTSDSTIVMAYIFSFKFNILYFDACSLWFAWMKVLRQLELSLIDEMSFVIKIPEHNIFISEPDFKYFNLWNIQDKNFTRPA